MQLEILLQTKCDSDEMKYVYFEMVSMESYLFPDCEEEISLFYSSKETLRLFQDSE